MRAQTATGAEENSRGARRKSRSPAQARDRHVRSAQNASTRSARRNLKERLQTGASGRLRTWERRNSRNTKVPPTFTQPAVVASGSERFRVPRLIPGNLS